jgi:hypothetical protein
LISKEEASVHPMRNVINQAFSLDPDSKLLPSCYVAQLQGDETILICSDGFNPVLESQSNPDPSGWQLQALLNTIRLTPGLSDNVSLCCLQVKKYLKHVSNLNVLKPPFKTAEESLQSLRNAENINQGGNRLAEDGLDAVQARKERRTKWLWFIISTLVLIGAFMLVNRFVQETESSNKTKKNNSKQSYPSKPKVQRQPSTSDDFLRQPASDPRQTQEPTRPPVKPGKNQQPAKPSQPQIPANHAPNL